MATVEQGPRSYYRGDQASGVTGPNLAQTCTFAEHICRARGKRTQFTSISLDPTKVRDFGDVTYRLKRLEADAGGHETIEHETLLGELRAAVQQSVKGARSQAIQALRRARLRKEGLVRWRFNISSLPMATLIAWAEERVQYFFEKM